MLQLYIVVFSLISSGQSCDIDKLTQNCKMFDPNSPFAQFSDGQKVINYSYKPYSSNTNQQNPQEIVDEVSPAERLEKIKRQAEALKIFSVTKKPASDEFKLLMAQQYHAVDSMLKEKPNSNLSKNENSDLGIEVIDPNPKNKEKIEFMDSQKFKEFIKAYYSDSQLKKIQELAAVHPSNKPKKQSSPTHPVYQSTTPLVSEQRMKELVDMARNAIISKIESGRPFSSLSPGEQDAIKKIRSVASTPGQDAKGGDCSGLLPNAFYLPENNSLNFCRNLQYLPEEAIVPIIGHELAHSIDPCFGQFGAIKIDKNRLKALMPAPKALDDEDIKGALKTMNDNQYQQMTTYLFERYSTDPDKTLRELEKMGVIKRISEDSVYEQFPFKSIVSCLEQKKFRSSRLGRDEYLEKLQQNYKLDPSKMDRLRSAYNKHPECLPVDGKNSQLGEAFADWFGSSVLENYLKQRKNQNSSLKPLAFFLNVLCAKKNNQEKRTSLNELLSDVDEKRKGEHPPSKDRLEKIFLSNPVIATAVGCKASEAKCELKKNKLSHENKNAPGVRK